MNRGQTKKGSMRLTPQNKIRRLNEDIERCTAALVRTEEALATLAEDSDQGGYLSTKKEGIERHIKWLEHRVVFWKNGGKPRAQR